MRQLTKRDPIEKVPEAIRSFQMERKPPEVMIHGEEILDRPSLALSLECLGQRAKHTDGCATMEAWINTVKITCGLLKPILLRFEDERSVPTSKLPALAK
jgi:hypothetical protein